MLSVVIITYNEERNIGRCLDSIKEIADDIVVVDSFSTDKTKEICLLKGARFFEHKFEGHIEQKNWAITQAKHPFILSLDADECVDEKLKNAIVKAKNNQQYDGYYMNRLTNYCGSWIRHCGWYPDKKLRLWDSRKGKWGGVNPHDKYEMDKSAKIGYLEGDLLHYSFYAIEEHIKQIHYFTDIAAKQAFKNGKKSSILKILFSPIVKFNRDYFFNLGFLDGYAGFQVCALSSFASYLKYAKLREQQKNGN